MKRGRPREPLRQQGHVRLRRGDALLGFVLRRMKDVHPVLTPNGVDRAKRVASVVGHDLQDAGPQPSERFGVHMLLADSRQVDRLSDFILHRRRSSGNGLSGCYAMARAR
jgi:hypothetical protein